MFAIDRCARADNNGQKDIKRREPKGHQAKNVQKFVDSNNILCAEILTGG